MLSLRILPRGVTHYFKQSSQRLHTSVKALNAKDSSSSSSDSSGSDSDTEDNKAKKKVVVQSQNKDDESPKISESNDRLNTLLHAISQASKKSVDTSETTFIKNNAADISINVAIKPKAERFKKVKEPKPVKEKPFEEQLVRAAKDVAQVLKGDTQKTELELLSLVLNVEKPTTDKKVSNDGKTSIPPINLRGILSNMKVDPSTPEIRTVNEKRQQMASKLVGRFEEPSIAQSLLYAKSMKKFRRSSKSAELNIPHHELQIFKDLSFQEMKDNPQLSTWEAMEEREMKLASFIAPQNVFQELILWTEQGKLWHFPINNEQGLEEEEKVHFSEHVFMERHLKDWCPRRGPIRHFMELVCVGLSKNPYLTVEEKIEHITWYKDYFEDKRDLLQDLGILDDKATAKVESQDKKQIEA